MSIRLRTIGLPLLQLHSFYSVWYAIFIIHVFKHTNANNSFTRTFLITLLSIEKFEKGQKRWDIIFGIERKRENSVEKWCEAHWKCLSKHLIFFCAMTLNRYDFISRSQQKNLCSTIVLHPTARKHLNAIV